MGPDGDDGDDGGGSDSAAELRSTFSQLALINAEYAGLCECAEESSRSELENNRDALLDRLTNLESEEPDLYQDPPEVEEVEETLPAPEGVPEDSFSLATTGRMLLGKMVEAAAWRVGTAGAVWGVTAAASALGYSAAAAAIASVAMPVLAVVGIVGIAVAAYQYVQYATSQEATTQGKVDGGISLFIDALSLKGLVKTAASGAYKALGKIGGAFKAACKGARVAEQQAVKAVTQTTCTNGFCGCFPAGTDVATPDGAVNIEDVELGQRVLPEFDGCSELPESGWVRIAATLPPEEGSPSTSGFDVELLRQEALVDAEFPNLAAGDQLYLDLSAELNVEGMATVHAIQSGVLIQHGHGCAVLGTFRHTANQLVSLRFSDGSNLEATPNHRLFSPERGWTPAGSLAVGDTLETLRGSALIADTSRQSGASVDVFNLQVYIGARYYVGDAAVLAHNQYGKTQPRKTSRAARREAMREQGIPTSQQPSSSSRNESGRSYEYDVPKERGGKQIVTVQQQTLDTSHPNQGHWEAGKVKTDPVSGEVRMNKYGRPKLQNDKSKVDYDD